MLSPFSFLIQTNSVQNMSSLSLFTDCIFCFFSYMSFPLLAFHSGGRPRLHLSYHSLPICLCISESRDLWWDCCCFLGDFNISQPFHLSRCQPPHLFYGFTVTNEKSICLVDSDMVLGQRILASCSRFSVMAFVFYFTGVERVGEGRLSFSCLFLSFFKC